MADKKILSRLTNQVTWQEDKASRQRTLKSIRNMKKEYDKVFKSKAKAEKASMVNTGQGRQTASQAANKTTKKSTDDLNKNTFAMRNNDAMLKTRNKHLKEQASIQRQANKAAEAAERARARGAANSARAAQRLSIRKDETYKDVMANPVMRNASKEMQLEAALAIKSAKTNKEISRIKSQILYKQRQINRAMKTGNVIQDRMNASIMQMVGGLGSAYAAMEGMMFIMNTGMSFERINTAIKAVSASTEEAAENFQFVRKEATRLGLDLVETGRGFSQMLAAGGDAVGLQGVKDIFSSISEVSVAMGLSADDTAGAIKAVNQMFSKGKIQAEELRGQLGERLPIAFKTMAKAAMNVGLIPFTEDINQATAALDKMMADGKLFSNQILPEFGRELKLAAYRNDSLAHALQHNLQPALGRAKLTLQDLSNSVFQGGLKEGIIYALGAFGNLGEEAHGLAEAIGGFLKGAIQGLTLPINLVVAALQDFAYILKENNILSEETIELIGKVIPQVLGLAAGFFTLSKMIGLVVKGAKMLSGVGTAIETMGGDGIDGDTGGKKGKKGKKGKGALGALKKTIGRAVNTATVGTSLRGLGARGTAALVGGGALAAGGLMFAAKERNNEIGTGSAWGASPQEIELKVKVEASDEFDAMVESTSIKTVDDIMTQAYMDMYK